MAQQVFAFAKIDDNDARQKVYEEIKKGHSRFGMWHQKGSLKDKPYGKHAILLSVKKGDWIVHVNMPKYGKCVAVQTTADYKFDEGIECSWGKDFNNYFPIDKASIIEFDRNNPNVISSVNLAPRRRAQKVLQVEDFIRSITNLKEGKYDGIKKSDKSITHLQEEISYLLPSITKQIHEMNKSKAFECLLQRIFKNLPSTIYIQNGFGWDTDHGADLIVDFENPIINVNVTTRLIVQAKSYSGKYFDTNAIDQIATGIKKCDADAGLLITTAQETEKLEEYIREKSEEIGKTIDLITGDDVAKFVLRYAPELLIGV